MPGCPSIPIAQGLLKFIPLPNVTQTAPDAPNFHFVTSTLNDSDDLNIRLNQSLGGATQRRARPARRQRGPRNNLSFGFHYHSASANLTNPFPSVGGNTHTRSFDMPIGYVRTFGKVVNNARLDFNRSRTSTQNLYAFNQDITGTLGITGFRRIRLTGVCPTCRSPISAASTTSTRNCCATRPGRFPTT